MSSSSSPQAVALWQHARAVSFPVMMAVGIPSILVWQFNPRLNKDQQLIKAESASHRFVRKICGIGCVVAGLGLFIETNRLFHTKGRGTLGPFDPPKELVTEGVFAYLRNPMLLGVYMCLLGQVLVTNSKHLGQYFGLFLAMTGIWFKMYEEPMLEQKFGAKYVHYKHHVPMIVPRLSPYRPN